VVCPDDLPHVSIIIPVFNQRVELLECLRALGRQTCQDGFEVVVVDNSSDEPLGDLAAPFPFARLLHEPKPGSYAARNRGIDAARGTLLGFIDADCLPAPDWIERGVAAIRRLPEGGMIGGRIDLTSRNPQKPTSAELYESVFAFPQERFVSWGFAATANLFTTKATVARVGPFNESLMSSGDMEWGQRVRACGLAQEYADDVRVSHPSRPTLHELFRKVRRVAGGNQQLADQRGEGTAGLLAYAWRQLVQLRRLRANVYHDRLDSVSRKLRFAAVVWIVDLLRTIERYRVHYGGTPRRT
jgi:glycosyltransferase involved in cell wall biosynthesis